MWEDIVIDFTTGLPKYYGDMIIMVFKNILIKYSHFWVQNSDDTSKSVAEAFMLNIVELHGLIKSIVSDRDKVFTSNFWQNMFKLQGTTL